MVSWKSPSTILVSFVVIINLTEGDECNFVTERRTYFCSGIADIFPSKFYGRYHLQCVNCRIPVFGSGTFPIQAELLSFNASDSGIQNITKGAFANLPLLQNLYLDNNQISGIAPGAFEGLRQLNELTLDNNELAVLAPEFLRGLQSVSISMTQNHIKEIYLDAFKGSMGILALGLSYNQIGILHSTSFAGLQNLEILDLKHNKICYIPLGIFRHVSRLRELNLSDNNLRSFAPGTFSGLRDLMELNLAGNQFAEFDSAFLLPLNRITKLDISRNSFYYLDAHSLHSSAPTIRILAIDDNLWSCSILTNLIQYLKTVNIDTDMKPSGRYDLTNVNGILCLMGDIQHKIPFEKYLGYVEYHTNLSINYC